VANDIVTKCLGIVNQFNPLSVNPGSLAKADNAVNLRENILEDRRGYKVDATLSANISQLMQFNGKVLCHNGTTISYGPGSYSNYSGSYSAPTSSRIRSQEANSNLYLTTSSGVKVLSDTAGTAARSAGVPRPLDPSYALNAGGTGFLAASYQCAYRTVLQRTDANGNVFFSYPSQRLWVANTAGTSKNVDLTTYLPAEAIAGDVLQFYRTIQQSGTATDLSGDEMALVYQISLPSSAISSGAYSFTDSISDSLMGATLYTSPSQQGISQANDRPPVCKDMALYRSSFMFYGNCQTKQRLFINMVGVSGLTGKTITLAGVTYNFGATEIITGGGSPQVQVSATGVVAVDIDLTARSLCRVVNRYASNTAVYAYYLSGPSDLPGKIMIEERGIGAAAYSVLSSDTTIAGMFFPSPPVGTANTASTSTNTVQKNAIYFSKYQEIEHVPILNYFLVGPANKNILRIVALRESLVIIKEEGVYRLTGESASTFTVTPIDLTVFCKAENSVAVVSNQVMMLSNQGVVSITENGIQVVSHDIEPSIKKMLTSSILSASTFGVGYESDRLYLISSVTDSSSTAADQTFVYNVFTKTWVRWTYAFNSAVIEPQSDKMYFAKSTSTVYVERKDGSPTDYADPDISITIVSIVGSVVTFTVSGAVPIAGWVISQNGTEIQIDSFITLATSYQATMNSVPPSAWTTGAAIMYPSVGMSLVWNAWTGTNAAILKQVRMAKILTDSTTGENTSTKLDATFKSNFDEETETVPLSLSSSGWGGPWGSIAWGGGSDSYGYPTIVPKNKQYCTRMNLGVNHKAAREKVAIAGFGFDFEISSDRIGR